MGGSLPFRSGVVVSLRPLSVCHGHMWLVPALFSSLSLSFPVCAHLLLGRDFLLLPDCPSPYFRLLVYWFLWLLFSTGVPYLRDGVTPAGSWTDCPNSERRFSLSILVRYAGQFLAGLCLRVSARPVTQGMLPGGPHCVLTIRLTVALSRVLHGPLLGLSVASPTLTRGLGWFFVPYPLFCRLGLVPRSVAQLCALQPLVPSFRVYLSEAVGFGGFLGSLLCAPLAVGLPPGSPNRLCPLSADCLFRLGAFSFGCGFRLCRSVLLAPWGCRCACCSLPEAASQREFFPLCLVLPLPGSVTFSRVCSSVGGPVGVAHSFLPSLLLGGGLVRLCGGLCCRSLALSRACPTPFICVGLLVSSQHIVAPLALCLS